MSEECRYIKNKNKNQKKPVSIDNLFSALISLRAPLDC